MFGSQLDLCQQRDVGVIRNLSLAAYCLHPILKTMPVAGIFDVFVICGVCSDFMGIALASSCNAMLLFVLVSINQFLACFQQLALAIILLSAASRLCCMPFACLAFVRYPLSLQ